MPFVGAQDEGTTVLYGSEMTHGERVEIDKIIAEGQLRIVMELSLDESTIDGDAVQATCHAYLGQYAWTVQSGQNELRRRWLDKSIVAAHVFGVSSIRQYQLRCEEMKLDPTGVLKRLSGRATHHDKRTIKIVELSLEESTETTSNTAMSPHFASGLSWDEHGLEIVIRNFRQCGRFVRRYALVLPPVSEQDELLQCAQRLFAAAVNLDGLTQTEQVPVEELVLTLQRVGFVVRLRSGRVTLEHPACRKNLLLTHFIGQNSVFVGKLTPQMVKSISAATYPHDDEAKGKEENNSDVDDDADEVTDNEQGDGDGAGADVHDDMSEVTVEEKQSKPVSFMQNELRELSLQPESGDSDSNEESMDSVKNKTGPLKRKPRSRIGRDRGGYPKETSDSPPRANKPKHKRRKMSDDDEHENTDMDEDGGDMALGMAKIVKDMHQENELPASAAEFFARMKGNVSAPAKDTRYRPGVIVKERDTTMPALSPAPAKDLVQVSFVSNMAEENQARILSVDVGSGECKKAVEENEEKLEVVPNKEKKAVNSRKRERVNRKGKHNEEEVDSAKDDTEPVIKRRKTSGDS